MIKYITLCTCFTQLLFPEHFEQRSVLCSQIAKDENPGFTGASSWNVDCPPAFVRQAAERWFPQLICRLLLVVCFDIEN